MMPRARTSGGGQVKREKPFLGNFADGVYRCACGYSAPERKRANFWYHLYEDIHPTGTCNHVKKNAICSEVLREINRVVSIAALYTVEKCSPAKCRKCSFTSTLRSFHELVHLAVQDKTKHLCCPHCPFSCDSLLEFTIHSSCHAENLPKSIIRLHSCPYCQVVFNQGDMIDDHIEKEHSEEELTYQTSKLVADRLECSKCNVTVATEAELMRHLEISHGYSVVQRYLKEVYGISNIKIVEKEEGHLESESHGPELNELPVHSGYTLIFFEKLRIGIDTSINVPEQQLGEQDHLELPTLEKCSPTKCLLCSFTTEFRLLGVIHEHIHSTQQDQTKQHLCSYCPFSCDKIQHLQLHSSGHRENQGKCAVKEYKCPHCSLVVSDVTVIEAHLEAEHGNLQQSYKTTKRALTEIQCYQCNKVFRDERSLMEHLQGQPGHCSLGKHLRQMYGIIAVDNLPEKQNSESQNQRNSLGKYIILDVTKTGKAATETHESMEVDESNTLGCRADANAEVHQNDIRREQTVTHGEDKTQTIETKDARNDTADETLCERMDDSDILDIRSETTTNFDRQNTGNLNNNFKLYDSKNVSQDSHQTSLPGQNIITVNQNIIIPAHLISKKDRPSSAHLTAIQAIPSTSNLTLNQVTPSAANLTPNQVTPSAANLTPMQATLDHAQAEPTPAHSRSGQVMPSRANLTPSKVTPILSLFTPKQDVPSPAHLTPKQDKPSPALSTQIQGIPSTATPKHDKPSPAHMTGIQMTPSTANLTPNEVTPSPSLLTAEQGICTPTQIGSFAEAVSPTEGRTPGKKNRLKLLKRTWNGSFSEAAPEGADTPPPTQVEGRSTKPDTTLAGGDGIHMNGHATTTPAKEDDVPMSETHQPSHQDKEARAMVVASTSAEAASAEPVPPSEENPHPIQASASAEQEDRFRCAYESCSYQKPHRQTVERHIKVVHLDYKPYVCLVCNYRAVFRCEVTKHMNKHKEHVCDDSTIRYEKETEKEELARKYCVEIETAKKPRKPYKRRTLSGPKAASTPSRRSTLDSWLNSSRSPEPKTQMTSGLPVDASTDVTARLLSPSHSPVVSCSEDSNSSADIFEGQITSNTGKWNSFGVVPLDTDVPMASDDLNLVQAEKSVTPTFMNVRSTPEEMDVTQTAPNFRSVAAVPVGTSVTPTSTNLKSEPEETDVTRTTPNYRSVAEESLAARYRSGPARVETTLPSTSKNLDFAPVETNIPLTSRNLRSFTMDSGIPSTSQNIGVTSVESNITSKSENINVKSAPKETEVSETTLNFRPFAAGMCIMPTSKHQPGAAPVKTTLPSTSKILNFAPVETNIPLTSRNLRSFPMDLGILPTSQNLGATSVESSITPKSENLRPKNTPPASQNLSSVPVETNTPSTSNNIQTSQNLSSVPVETNAPSTSNSIRASQNLSSVSVETNAPSTLNNLSTVSVGERERPKPKKGMYECLYCPRGKSQSEHIVRQHVKKVHLDNYKPYYQCEVCNQRATEKHFIRNHIQVNHAGDRACGFKYITDPDKEKFLQEAYKLV